jgi:hypothetical protein
MDSLPNLVKIARMSDEMRIKEGNGGSALEQFSIHPLNSAEAREQ